MLNDDHWNSKSGRHAGALNIKINLHPRREENKMKEPCYELPFAYSAISWKEQTFLDVAPTLPELIDLLRQQQAEWEERQGEDGDWLDQLEELPTDLAAVMGVGLLINISPLMLTESDLKNKRIWHRSENVQSIQQIMDDSVGLCGLNPQVASTLR